MVQLDISELAAQKLDQLSKQTQKSVDELILLLVDEYGDSVSSPEVSRPEDEGLPLTDEEVADLLTPKEPLTGRQIAERGLLGAWKDEGITDSLEWLEQQRAKRRNKFTW